jgi:hypothetical protein
MDKNRDINRRSFLKRLAFGPLGWVTAVGLITAGGGVATYTIKEAVSTPKYNTAELRLRRLPVVNRGSDGLAEFGKIEAALNTPINITRGKQGTIDNKALFDNGLEGEGAKSTTLGTIITINGNRKYIEVQNTGSKLHDYTQMQVFDLDIGRNGNLLQLTQYFCQGGRTRPLKFREIIRGQFDTSKYGKYPFNGNPLLRNADQAKINLTYNDAKTESADGDVMGKLFIYYTGKPIGPYREGINAMLNSFYAEVIQAHINQPIQGKILYKGITKVEMDIKADSRDTRNSKTPVNCYVIAWLDNVEKTQPNPDIRIRAYPTEIPPSLEVPNKEPFFEWRGLADGTNLFLSASGHAAKVSKYKGGSMRYFTPMASNYSSLDSNRLMRSKIRTQYENICAISKIQTELSKL